MQVAVVERTVEIPSQRQDSLRIRRARLSGNKPFVTGPVALRVRCAKMLNDAGVTIKSGQ